VRLSEVKAKGVFHVDVDLGEAFDGEAENPFEGQHVTLRELTTQEQIKLESVKPEEYSSTFLALLPKLIIGHSFEDDEGAPAAAKDVSQLIEHSTTLFQHVLTIWSKSLPFVKRSARNSEKSQSQLSTEESLRPGSMTPQKSSGN